MATIKLKGLDEFLRALERNPALVKNETSNYFVRGMALLRKTIMGSPWRISAIGGGVPVATGNLKIAHSTDIQRSYAKIYVNESKAKYARYVHEGTYRMEARPWLDYAKMTNERAIAKLQDDLLKTITADLAK